MNDSQILIAKHGLIFGSGGSGKSYFIRKLLKENSHKIIYTSIHGEDMGDIPCIIIKDPSLETQNKDSFLETKDFEILKIPEYINKNKSFVIQIQSGYVGQLLASEYLNDVVLEILKYNKDFTLVIDDAFFLAGPFSQTYKILLTQKVFPVVSIYQYMREEIKYIFDYTELIYMFKLSRSDFPDFDPISKRG